MRAWLLLAAVLFLLENELLLRLQVLLPVLHKGKEPSYYVPHLVEASHFELLRSLLVSCHHAHALVHLL